MRRSFAIGDDARGRNSATITLCIAGDVSFLLEISISHGQLQMRIRERKSIYGAFHNVVEGLCGRDRGLDVFPTFPEDAAASDFEGSRPAQPPADVGSSRAPLQGHAGVVTSDTSGVIVHANVKATEVFGYALSELVGQPVTMLMEEALRPLHQSFVERYLRTKEGRVINARDRLVSAVRKNGKHIKLLLSLTSMVVDGKLHFVAAFLVPQSTAMKISADPRGVITSASKNVARAFGWTASELVGQNVSVLCPEPHRKQHDQYIKRYDTFGMPRVLGVARNLRAQHRDGSTFPISLQVRKYHVMEGLSWRLRPVSSRALPYCFSTGSRRAFTLWIRPPRSCWPRRMVASRTQALSASSSWALSQPSSWASAWMRCFLTWGRATRQALHGDRRSCARTARRSRWCASAPPLRMVAARASNTVFATWRHALVPRATRPMMMDPPPMAQTTGSRGTMQIPPSGTTPWRTCWGRARLAVCGAC